MQGYKQLRKMSLKTVKASALQYL